MIYDKRRYAIRKFEDGWWSLLRGSYGPGWGKWRGPFSVRALCEIDLVNTADDILERSIGKRFWQLTKEEREQQDYYY